MLVSIISFIETSMSFSSPGQMTGVVNDSGFTSRHSPCFSRHQVIDCIRNGRLLERPSICPEGVYDIMLGCWKTTPQERLPMKDIHRQLDALCMAQPTYIDIIA